MPTKLTAKPLAAGIFPNSWEEERPIGPPAEKGGWITLLWEAKPDVFEHRTVSVSPARARQAMNALRQSAFPWRESVRIV